MYIATVNGNDVLFKSFTLTESLLYVIKKVSNEKENDIISYFYEMGIKLFNDCISRKTLPMRCNRTVKVFYKNTDIYVKFGVYSDYFSRKTSFGGSRETGLYMFLDHPRDSRITIYGKDINDSITENLLDLSDEQVLKAKKPQQKKYKCMGQSGVSSLDKKHVDLLPQELVKKFMVNND